MVLVGALLPVAAACGGAAVEVGQVPTSGPATSGRPLGSAPAPPVGTTPGTSTPPGTSPSVTEAPTSAPRATPAPTSAAPSTAAPALPATHAVSRTQLALSDSSRATVSRGRTLSASRSLPTTVYHPSDAAGPFPLVVFAHGFQIGPGPYQHLCEQLAAAGYVVAAPSFPLTDQGAAGANLDRGDLPNQAGDVSVVISGVLGGGTGAGALAGKVDGSRVGIVGHSDGADTALDVGYYPGRTDSRVKAVVALAPDAMTGSGGSVGAGTPLLLEHGDRDSIVPISNSRTVFGQVRSHRFFLVLNGADHLPPVQGAAPWAPVLEGAVVAFLDRYVAGRTSTDQAILDEGRRPGVATLETAG